MGRLKPAPGGEITQTRPTLIVSNNNVNNNLKRVQVIPLTSNISQLHTGEALVSVAEKPDKPMFDPIIPATKVRMKSSLGTICHADILKLEKVIRLQLGMRF